MLYYWKLKNICKAATESILKNTLASLAIKKKKNGKFTTHSHVNEVCLYTSHLSMLKCHFYRVKEERTAINKKMTRMLNYGCK